MITFEKEADTLFQHAFQYAAIGMAIVDMDGNYVGVNPQLCKMFGYSEAELTRMNFADITHPDDVATTLRMKDTVLDGSKEFFDFEKRYISRDGRHIWVRITGTLVRNDDGTPRFFLTQMQDISHRKKAEHLLNYHIQQYRSLFDKNPDIVYVVSLDGEIANMNASVGKITGYTAEEWAERPPKEIAESIHRALNSAGEGIYDSLREELAIVAKDGRVVHLSVTHMPIVIDGEAVGVFGIAKDITEQVNLLVQWQDKEKKYRLLAEHSLDMIVSFNAFGVLTYVSPSAKSVLGYAAEEMSGRRAVDFIHPDDQEEVRQAFRGAFSDCCAGSDESRNIFRAVMKDGQFAWIEAVTKIVRRNGRTGRGTEFVAVLRDVSEREEERERLRKIEERFRLIADNVTDVITVSDRFGIIRYVTRSIFELAGYEPEELIGTNIVRHFHPDDIAAIRSRPGGENMIFRCRLRRKDGIYVEVESAVNRIRDEEGKTREIVSITRALAGGSRLQCAEMTVRV